MSRETPLRQLYDGTKCGHCGSGNTAVEVYRHSKEGLCLTCGREYEPSFNILVKLGLVKQRV